MRTALSCLLLSCGLLTGCASSDARKVMHADLNKTAYVMLLAEPSTAPYVIHLAYFDDVAQILEPYRYKDELLRVDAAQTPAYVAINLTPGVYVIASLFQQDQWGVCFSGETRSFSVFAGEAVFLGDFRPKAHLGQIQSLTEKSGQMTLPLLSRITYFDDIIPPQITTPTIDGADFLEAKRYEASSLPMLTGHLKPVEYQPARFPVVSGSSGEKRCS